MRREHLSPDRASYPLWTGLLALCVAVWVLCRLGFREEPEPECGRRIGSFDASATAPLPTNSEYRAPFVNPDAKGSRPRTALGEVSVKSVALPVPLDRIDPSELAPSGSAGW